MIDKERLLRRFLRYVQIDTMAREGAAEYPSSLGQLELGKLLVSELRCLGLADAEQDEHGIVLATLPPTVAEAPVVALCSHLDTSPETSGKNVRPRVVRNYDGSDLVLPGDPRQVLRVAEQPELAACRGHDIVTTDGTTLLGADDKAGVATIMETVETLLAHPEIPRGPLRICFTCDEEIGRGVDFLDPGRIGAVACYTLDGQGAGEIDLETFSADLATATIRGVNIHPAIAKGRMVNAVRVAADFLARLPRSHLAPEVTEGREGFLHPYRIEGGVAETKIRILLRDFDTPRLAELADVLRAAADACRREFPQAEIDVAVSPQYRNLADGLAREPRAAAFAEEAIRRLGLQPRRTVVRGGTDGSRLTELGLPTPNLSCGQHNPHSPLEWVSLDEMKLACQTLVELAKIWAQAR